jgi:YD repeat-containing protein
MRRSPLPRRLRAGFSLTEMLFAMGITTLLVLVVVSFTMFSNRSFVTLSNYVELDDANRLAMDQLTRDLRQCNRITSATSTVLTVEDSDGFSLTYTYDPAARTLTRTQGGAVKVLLTQCDSLSFTLGQRNPVGGSYDVYPAATAATAKLVNVSWVCSRKILGVKANTESVQTARIVIRKQGT